MSPESLTDLVPASEMKQSWVNKRKLEIIVRTWRDKEERVDDQGIRHVNLFFLSEEGQKILIASATINPNGQISLSITPGHETTFAPVLRPEL